MLGLVSIASADLNGGDYRYSSATASASPTLARVRQVGQSHSFTATLAVAVLQAYAIVLVFTQPVQALLNRACARLIGFNQPVSASIHRSAGVVLDYAVGMGLTITKGALVALQFAYDLATTMTVHRLIQSSRQFEASTALALQRALSRTSAMAQAFTLQTTKGLSTTWSFTLSTLASVIKGSALAMEMAYSVACQLATGRAIGMARSLTVTHASEWQRQIGKSLAYLNPVEHAVTREIALAANFVVGFTAVMVRDFIRSVSVVFQVATDATMGRALARSTLIAVPSTVSIRRHLTRLVSSTVSALTAISLHVIPVGARSIRAIMQVQVPFSRAWDLRAGFAQVSQAAVRFWRTVTKRADL